MNWIVYVLSPAFVHLLLSEGVAVLAENTLDSAACTALSSAVVLPVAVWMYRKDGALRKRSPGLQRAFLLLCFAGGGLLNVIWSGMMDFLGITSFFSNSAQEALLGSPIAMQLLGPGLLVPIAEELVFRGLVYTRMRTRLGVCQAVLFSSLLFALYHGNPIQMIYVFPMALILALLYEKGGSLIWPVLFHIGANLPAILLA